MDPDLRGDGKLLLRLDSLGDDDAFVEVSAVVKVGEEISYGEVFQGPLCELALCDVAEKRDLAYSIPYFVSER